MEQAGPIGNVDVNFSMKNDLRNALKSVQADASEQEGLFLALKDAPLTNSMREAKYRAQQYSQNANEKWFCFSVVDTGNGMEPGQIEKLFRSDDKPTKKESGSAKVENTRLGMFVAVELCRRLGGFIACLSTPHAGTIFHVGIPVTMETGNTDTNVIAKPVKQPIIISGPITIVGDDTLGLKKQVMKQCERMRLDVEVIQVKSGREAVDKFSGDRTPSVLIIGKFRMQKASHQLCENEENTSLMQRNDFQISQTTTCPKWMASRQWPVYEKPSSKANSSRPTLSVSPRT